MISGVNTKSLLKKSTHHRVPHRFRFLTGSVSVEYVLLASLVCVVLFAGQPSPLDRLLDAIETQYENFSILVALP